MFAQFECQISVFVELHSVVMYNIVNGNVENLCKGINFGFMAVNRGNGVSFSGFIIFENMIFENDVIFSFVQCFSSCMMHWINCNIHVSK